MKKTFLLLFVIIGFGVSANAQKIVSFQHDIKQSQARLIESQTGVITTPVIGELGEIANYKIEHSFEFDISKISDANLIVSNLDSYKQYTIANYCSMNNYDLIINPLFQVATNEEGNILKVTVTGFPARYSKFRLATEQDSWMLDFMNTGVMDDRLRKIIGAN